MRSREAQPAIAQAQGVPKGNMPSGIDTVDPVPFIRPPEAPVFEPSEEEFAGDPLAYISKIRPIAEKYGICKIRPPKSWRPPFAANLANYKFTPRVQRINELEVTTRIKMNFLNDVAKFIELQGSILRIPIVNGKYLDLWKLHKIVADEGGFERCCLDRGRWKRVAMRMGTAAEQSTTIGNIYKTQYEKFLYPYDTFKAGVYDDLDQSANDIEQSATGPGSQQRLPRYNRRTKTEEPQSSTNAPVVTVPTPPAENPASAKRPSSARAVKNVVAADSAAAKPPLPSGQPTKSEASSKIEIAGRTKTGTLLKKVEPAVVVKSESASSAESPAVQPPANNADGAAEPMAKSVPYEQILCESCHRGDSEDRLLLCDTCPAAFHTYCLLPPMSDIPKYDWCCPRCVTQEMNKPSDPYGFLQSSKQYSLVEYGEMADNFKRNYFRLPVYDVPIESIEKEFWRLTGSIHDRVQVEYGADVHVLDMGSGFPVEENKHQFPGDESYAASPWNLNNLPLLPRCLLRFVSGEITGMKVPWCYVGMCFSCFCGHAEDHWTYSINYLHWGEPKTWYGVPSNLSSKLEALMRTKAPQLFAQSPDLLHQLTTILSPNELMNAGISVYRTDQKAGEFVITFPKSFHTGYNNGYNFAEAVNFCLPEWLPYGRQCIDEYRAVNRMCVFSHDELVSKLAINPGLLDADVAGHVAGDMTTMIEVEKMLRRRIFDAGIIESSRRLFEVTPDEERQCRICRTMLFLSAISCSCSPTSLICLHHSVDELGCSCDASSRKMLYRYTLEELNTYLETLKDRANAYSVWSARVDSLFESSAPKLDIVEAEKLLEHALEKGFSDTDLVLKLKDRLTSLEKAEKRVTDVLVRLNRTKLSTSNPLTLENLASFVNELDGLEFEVSALKGVRSILLKAQRFESDVDELRAQSIDDISLDYLRELQRFADTYHLALPGVETLAKLSLRKDWLTDYDNWIAKNELDDNPKLIVDFEHVRQLADRSCTACLSADDDLPLLEHVRDLLSYGEDMEQRCQAFMAVNPQKNLSEAVELVEKASRVKLRIGQLEKLKDSIVKAGDWVKRAEEILKAKNPPMLKTAERFVEEAADIALKIDLFEKLNKDVDAGRTFIDRANKMWISKQEKQQKASSPQKLLSPQRAPSLQKASSRINPTSTGPSLIEILSPRVDIGLRPNPAAASISLEGSSSRKPTEPPPPFISDIVTTVPKIEFLETKTPNEIWSTYSDAARAEVEAMVELRNMNIEKMHRISSSGGGSAIVSLADIRPPVFCICRKPATSNMLMCCLCRDWFHNGCCNTAMRPNTQVQRFLCQLCLRSRRPRIESILGLLLSLQQLSVRTFEGDVLQFLSERIVAWQTRVRSTPIGLSSGQQELAVKCFNSYKKDGTVSSELASQLDDYSVAGLDRLFVEGELMEASLNEVDMIWTVLTAARKQFRTPTPQSSSPPRSGHPHSGGGKSSPSHSPSKSAIVKHQLKRQREKLLEKSKSPAAVNRSNSANSSGRRAASSGVDLLMAALAKASKKRQDEDVELQKRMETESKVLGRKNAQQTAAAKAKVKAAVVGRRPSRPGRASDSSEVSSVASKTSKPTTVRRKRKAWSNDDCAADDCQRPDGDVQWVQCESCDGWYHMPCIGYPDQHVFSDDEHFFCSKCNRKKKQKAEQCSSNEDDRTNSLDILAETSSAAAKADLPDQKPEDLTLPELPEGVQASERRPSSSLVLTDQDAPVDLDRHVASMLKDDFDQIFGHQSADVGRISDDDIADDIAMVSGSNRLDANVQEILQSLESRGNGAGDDGANPAVADNSTS